MSFFEQYKKEILLTVLVVLLVVGAIGFYTHILKKTHQRLEEACLKAEEANQSKSAFLTNMSHEIHTPLDAIAGSSDLPSQVKDKEEMKEYADIVETNTDPLLQLISDILNMSKIESGTYDFHITRADVNQMILEIEQVGKLRTKSEELALTFNEQLPQCTLYTDKNRPAQVIINLLTDTIKFTSGEEIRMGHRLKGAATLYFYVSDTGCGMSTEQYGYVFERFVKYNPFVQGTGLGLPISRMIIEKLGGEVGVTSGVGKGSLFWFTLPYRTSV